MQYNKNKNYNSKKKKSKNTINFLKEQNVCYA